MNSLKFHLGPPCSIFLHPVGGEPRFRSVPSAGWAAVFYPFGHPTPYAYGFEHLITLVLKISQEF
jgi:hypothetical protein